MEQKIKKIVAVFLNSDENSINAETKIDRSAIKGSIMIHRMYAVIEKELNLPIKGYDKIKNFGDLLRFCGLEPLDNKNTKLPEQSNHLVRTVSKMFSIGIDLEDVGLMPKVSDSREDIFYKQNFSQGEISYCLLQPDPLQSFAGKFAAKEAIVKADSSYKGIPFSKIEIGNDSNSSPYFKDFAISISHADKFAVAVAIKITL